MSYGYERTAIWMAHSKKCIYCGESIQFRDLEIDHILPASLEDEPQKLISLKETLGLSQEFDINTAYNFVPVHDWCNKKKTNRVFAECNLRFFLEIAQGKLETIEKLIAGLKLKDTKESLLGRVQKAFVSGIMEYGDLIDAVSEVKGFPLSTKIAFMDGEWNGSDHTTEIDQLLDRPILFGGTASIDGVEFVNESGESMVIRTCREYRAAKTAGYYAYTTFAMKMEAFLSAADAVIEAASRAQIPVISYLKTPHVGVADLNLLSSEVLPAISVDNQSSILALGNVSLRDLALLEKISIIDVSSTRLNIEYGGLGMLLKELMRADLDGDGIEEILVQYYTYAIEGTLGVSSIGLLRRTDPNAKFIYESWPKKLALVDW